MNLLRLAIFTSNDPSEQVGSCFNIKTVFLCIRISIIKIRRSYLYDGNLYTDKTACVINIVNIILCDELVAQSLHQHPKYFGLSGKGYNRLGVLCGVLNEIGVFTLKIYLGIIHNNWSMIMSLIWPHCSLGMFSDWCALQRYKSQRNWDVGLKKFNILYGYI